MFIINLCALIWDVLAATAKFQDISKIPLVLRQPNAQQPHPLTRTGGFPQNRIWFPFLSSNHRPLPLHSLFLTKWQIPLFLQESIFILYNRYFDHFGFFSDYVAYLVFHCLPVFLLTKYMFDFIEMWWKNQCSRRKHQKSGMEICQPSSETAAGLIFLMLKPSAFFAR